MADVKMLPAHSRGRPKDTMGVKNGYITTSQYYLGQGRRGNDT